MEALGDEVGGLVRQFDHTDLATVNRWYEGHEKPGMPLGALPQYGLIVENVAAGFLFTTDGDFAIIEAYVANPQSEKTQRSEALDRITAGLVEHARAQGFKSVLALSRHPAIEARAQRLGFSAVGTYRMLSLAL